MSETRRHVASSHIEVNSHIHFVTAPNEPVKSLKVRSYQKRQRSDAAQSKQKNLKRGALLDYVTSMRYESCILQNYAVIRCGRSAGISAAQASL
jgi:hypothetical protein